MLPSEHCSSPFSTPRFGRKRKPFITHVFSPQLSGMSQVDRKRRKSCCDLLHLLVINNKMHRREAHAVVVASNMPATASQDCF